MGRGRKKAGDAIASENGQKVMQLHHPERKLMQLIHLDLEIDRPEFIEDPTFNVIPNIEDFIDADFDFLEEDEIDGTTVPQNGQKMEQLFHPETEKICGSDISW